MRRLLFTGPRLHASWHIAAVSLGVLTGAVLAIFTDEIFAGFHWPVIGVILLLATSRKKYSWLIVVSITSGTIIGLWTGSNHQLKLRDYQNYADKQVILSGTVKDDTVRGPSGDQRLLLNQIHIDGDKLAGTVWLNTATQSAIKRGDIVSVSGRLGEGFGTVTASVFRADVIEIVRPEPGDVGRRVRDWFAGKVRLSIPEPQASLGVSYLVGQRRALPEDLGDALQTLGLVHLVVASGFHLTIAVRFSRRVTGRLSKYTGLLMAFCVIGGFLLITGFSTSMIRAALVTSLSLLAWSVGRVIHPVVLLLFVAALTVLINPSYILGDIGWFLSFAAFTGVIILAPLIHDYFWGKQRRPRMVRDLLVTTTSAQITTLPIVAYTFGQYSSLALVSNLLILPLVPVTMLLTLIAGAMTSLLPAAAMVFGFPAYVLLGYMTIVANWLMSLPYASNEFLFGAPSLIASYIIILFIIGYLWIKTGHNFKKQNFVE